VKLPFEPILWDLTWRTVSSMSIVVAFFSSAKKGTTDAARRPACRLIKLRSAATFVAILLSPPHRQRSATGEFYPLPN
jgi:hypothetical protein